MTAGVGRRRPSRQPRQELADLRQERAALDKVQHGMALVIEALDAAPDEYRRAFVLCLALARLAEAARTPMAKATLQVAAGLDMRVAPVPAIMQAAPAGVERRRDLAPS